MRIMYWTTKALLKCPHHSLESYQSMTLMISGPTPHHWHGRVGFAPHLSVVFPVAWTDHLGIHPGFCVDTSNISQIYDLLEHMKGPALQNHSCRILKTRGNNRIFESSFSESPVLMVYQKPGAFNLTNNLLHNEYLQVKLFGQKGVVYDSWQLSPCH